MIAKIWRASILSLIMRLLFDGKQAKAWKPAKMPVPDKHISYEAIVQIQSVDGDTICAGVILGRRVVFTSSDCLRQVNTKTLQVYYAPNDPNFISVISAAENRANRAILLHLQQSLPICERIGGRRIGVIHWKRMSEIYMRNILYERSAWRSEESRRFIWAVLENWHECNEAELAFKQCPARL